MVGAVMNEQLRLLPPAVNIPKSTLTSSPQQLNISGKNCTVPPNTYIQLITTSTHRNPNQWPTGPPRDPDNPAHPLSNLDNDLEEFKPERWILDTEEKRQAATKITRAFAATAAETDSAASSSEASTAALGLDPANDTPIAPGFYKPPKGAYIPFSEGYRSCLGRRFAQVELLAAIAVIFKTYSVELAVDQWASDEEVERMDREQKAGVWEKARREVERQMRDDLAMVITLKLGKGHVPLRLVKRGAERFA